MKRAIKQFLYKRGIYYELKYSRLFHIYQRFFKPAEIRQEQKEIRFYRSFLPACKLIFDIGANDGHKTEAFLKISEKVVCCEPDDENFKLLQIRFRNKKNRIIIEKTAVSDTEGVALMNIHHAGSAFNTLSNKWKKVLESDNIERWNEKIKFSGSQEVKTISLDTLISKYGIPDFIKIDVEGFEEYVLKGLPHRVPYLSFETLLPDYETELKNCLSIIQSLDAKAQFNIALHEKLGWSHFVSITELEKWLSVNSNAPSFEVIVKMSV